MGRRQTYRGKPKKRRNRYNPNQPDYKAAHSPFSPVTNVLLTIFNTMLPGSVRK